MNGDIVKINEKIFKVEWLQDISSFILKDFSLLENDIVKHAEVIGNIYDSSELLEEE